MEGMVLNPDAEKVKQIQHQLSATKGYCPSISEFLWNEDTKCMCSYTKESGICRCGLFVQE